jgi:hypothetical protein
MIIPLFTLQNTYRVRVRITLRLTVYSQSVRLAAKPFETHDQTFFFQLNNYGHSLHITSSLTRGWMRHLQLLLVLASVFIVVSQSCGSRDHILLTQIRDFLFVASYDSQGYGGGILHRLHTGRSHTVESVQLNKTRCYLKLPHKRSPNELSLLVMVSEVSQFKYVGNRELCSLSPCLQNMTK